MTDPQTKSIDELLEAAARSANRRQEISDRLSILVGASAIRRQRYQHALEAGKVDRVQLLYLNDDWQKVEKEIIALTEEFQKLIPEIRETEV